MFCFNLNWLCQVSPLARIEKYELLLPASTGTDRRFVQSPSKLFLKEVLPFHTFSMGSFPNGYVK